MSEEVSKSIRIAVVTGALSIAVAVVGATFKGLADARLERTKLDSQIILKALDEKSIEERRRSLEFLVDTNLIEDEETKTGLRQYFEGENPKTPPRIGAFISSGEVLDLVPQVEADANKSDVTLFVCGPGKSTPSTARLVEGTKDALVASRQFGAIDAKVWEGKLYNEIPLEDLQGVTAVVLDKEHPEVNQWELFQTVLSNVPSLPEPKLFHNRGSVTAWRASIIICPTENR